jgi:hypothetical protein
MKERIHRTRSLDLHALNEVFMVRGRISFADDEYVVLVVFWLSVNIGV